MKDKIALEGDCQQNVSTTIIYMLGEFSSFFSHIICCSLKSNKSLLSLRPGFHSGEHIVVTFNYIYWNEQDQDSTPKLLQSQNQEPRLVLVTLCCLICLM